MLHIQYFLHSISGTIFLNYRTVYRFKLCFHTIEYVILSPTSKQCWILISHCSSFVPFSFSENATRLQRPGVINNNSETLCAYTAILLHRLIPKSKLNVLSESFTCGPFLCNAQKFNAKSIVPQSLSLISKHNWFFSLHFEVWSIPAVHTFKK